MAEIDLQKKRPRWGVWIVAALVAVLAIWALTELFDRDAPMAGDFDTTGEPAVVEPVPDPGADAAAELGTAGADAAVAEFRQQCAEEASQGDDMGAQHDWTVSCLERMATALEATIPTGAANDLAVREHVATLRQRAAEVRRADPGATSHAATVAAAFDAGAELIQSWQQSQRTAADAAASVQQAADRVTADQPLLDQRDAVHAYFEAVAEALPGGA